MYIFYMKTMKRKEEEEDNHEYRSWDQLPRHILKKIINQVNFADSARMSVVCKPWRLTVKEHNRAPGVWLMLNHYRSSNLLRFFDMSEGRFYDFKLPKNLQGGWCCGSSKGWLVIVKISTFKYFKPKIFLYNPISGIQFPLPSLESIPSFEYFWDTMRPCNNVSEFFYKVDLSSVDATNCVVAVTNCIDSTLAFCKPRDKRWTIFEGIENQDDGFAADILFYNGELHVLISEKASFETHKLKVGDDDVVLKLIPNNCFSILETREISWNAEDESGISIWIGKEASVESYLLESDGELLIVHEAINEIMTFLPHNGENAEQEDGPLFNYSQDNRFEVFKINPPTSSMRLTRLNSLGNQTLFVTNSSSLSVSERELKGLKKNCIFFLSNLDYSSDDLSNFDPYVSRESGVFCLEDGRIQRIFPSTKDSIHCRMHWFSPNIS